MRSDSADAIAEELQRRRLRLDELAPGLPEDAHLINHLRGEIIGLRGALGILLGGTVQDGTADRLGYDYHQRWQDRQEPTG
jgi:hypothetical protein